MRRALRIAAVVAAAALLSGCTSDPLAEDYLDGGNENYISGSGIVEIPEAERGDPVEFTGESDGGVEISRADYAGSVLVVNFWYASCAPCRAEAPDLEALSQKYGGQGAAFLGVNVYDGADTSLAFARNFGVTYPSVLDNELGDVRLAFAGQISPSAVPTTFVLDADGRIAARILGQLEERSILDTIVGDVVGETA
jgi:thiol-disulfide isomerase/thioredoxin